MQSLFAGRRVESGGSCDEGFWVPLGLDCRRGAVRGGHGWVRAEFEHEHAEEEAGDDVGKECVVEELVIEEDE